MYNLFLNDKHQFCYGRLHQYSESTEEQDRISVKYNKPKFYIKRLT